MTLQELLVYVTGVAAVLSVVPWLRALRMKMEFTRARIFLRWSSYNRALRLAGLALASFVVAIVASVIVEPEEYTLRTFMPVGLFLVILNVGSIYVTWTLYTIGREPRKRSAPLAIALTPGLGLKAVLVGTGIPAAALLLLQILTIRYENQAVKARYFLQFARTHVAHQRLVLLAVGGIIANLLYTAWNPSYLYEVGIILPTFYGVIFIHLAFLALGLFIAYTMGGLSNK